MSLNAKKILFFQINYILGIKLVATFFPLLASLEYLIDLMNFVLLFFLINKRNTLKREAKFVVGFIVFLIIFDSIRFIFDGENVILYLWGIRNQYRFFLMTLCCIAYFNVGDVEKLFNILYKWLVVNLPIVTIQFLMGYRGDYLGGTFGKATNCNASTNAFCLIVLTYSILGYLYKRIKLKRLMLVFGISMYWAVLAELKIFFIEVIIIVMVAIFIVKGRTMAKIKWVLFFLIVFAIGVFGIYIVFPEQLEYILSFSSMLEYASAVETGHGFTRIRAFSIVWKHFFKENPIYLLFGVGVGNAEHLAFGSISVDSNIFKQFQDYYGYYGYGHAFVFVERGIMGLLLYALFCFNSFKMAFRYRRFASENKTVLDTVIIISVFMIAIMYKDSSLRIATSGYMLFSMLAIPYICKKDIVKGK